MATLKTPIKENDPYIKKVINYIPAEVVAGYIAIAGYLAYNPDIGIPPNYESYYLIALIALVVITPFWTFYAVLDKNKSTREDIKRARFQAVVSELALLVWVYAIGNPILESILCHLEKAGSNECCIYSPVLGSIILVLFTLFIPLLDRIFLGTELPSQNETKTGDS